MRTFYLDDLEQTGTHQAIVSSLSLKGNQDKWHLKKEGVIVKAALFDGFVWWEDWKVEAIASQLLPLFDIEAVQQEPCRIDDGFGNVIYGSYSKDFRQQGERYYTFAMLLQKRGATDSFSSLPAQGKIETIVSVLTDYLGEPAASRYVEDMCLADYLLGNVDRHYENYGLLIRRDPDNTVVGKRPVPLYDFGMGLFQNQKVESGTSLEEAKNGMIISPFAVDLGDAYRYYEESWRRRCANLWVDLSGFDFPRGLGKEYLEQALVSLGVRLEGTC